MIILLEAIRTLQGGAGGDTGSRSNLVSQRQSRLRTTASRTCLALALSLGAGLPLWSQAASAQQITQGGGNGTGYSFGSGGIAGGGGGGGDRTIGFSGGDGGSAAQTPGGSATAGSAGTNDVGGIGGAGGAPGAPNDLSAAGGGGGGRGSYDSGFPRDGGAGGAGGGGSLLTTTSPLSLSSAYAGGTGADGSFGGSPAGSGGGGGGGGGLILTGAGVTMNTNGFSVSGGTGGGGASAGGGGAGLVLLNGGTITVAAGAGGTSVIAGGQGGDNYEGGHGGAGLFLYNGGSLSHQAGSITGGAGGAWAFTGSGGAGVLSNLGTIDNRASITGGKGGDSNAGGTGYGRGGAGLEAWGGSIANMAGGTITGGAGGNQSNANPVYVAGVGGTGIVFRDGQTASLDNAGTVSGGNGGIANSSSHGAGGVGIVGAASGGISIINSGTIAGGLAGDGVTRANAVALFGNNNRFEIRAGSTTDGNVVVQGGGINNMLALGGTVNGAANIGNLVASHTGFTAYEKTGSSTWTLSGAGNQNWTIREGTLSGNSSSMAGDLTFDTGAGTRGVVFAQGTGGTYSGTISGDGNFTLTGAAGGGLTLTRAQSYTGTTTIQNGTLRMGAVNVLASSSEVALNAGTWDLDGYDQTVKGLSGGPGTDVTLGSATLTVDNAGNMSYGGSISGTGGLTKTGAGIFSLRGANTYSGATNVASGFMRIGPGGSLLNSTAINISNGAHFNVIAPSALSPTVAVSLTGVGSLFSLTASQSIGSLAGTAATRVWLDPGMMLTTGGNHTSTVFSGNLGANGEGSLTKIGTGAFTLTGTNGYTGATAVNAGSLIVNGSIASSSGVTVAAGALLGGTGVVPTTVLNGGTLSPGNSPGALTVNGNLTFNPGSTYLAEIQGANADRVNVTGTAALAGTLRLAPLGGAYTFNSAYTLLSAAGGRTGVFGPVDATGSFGAGVTLTVSYTANDVLLTLTPNALTPGTPGFGVTAPRNAYAVATAVDIAVANGSDPSSLFGIYNLPAAAIPAAVNSLSGEVHTAAPAMANVVSDQFLRTMLDPTAAGRLGAAPAGPGAATFSGLVRKGADEPAAPSRLDVPFYSVWGSAYGSYGRTDGNAAIGSTKRTIDDAHLATGIDVRLLPGTIAGIAVSGGRARASLPDLVGKVDADVFQAGLYGTTQLGPVKLGGAMSYAQLENEVSRSIPALRSSLSSSYATTAWSGRLQANAALLDWNGLSVSPLAAIQGTQARSPAVIEANWAGAHAGALALAKRSDVTTRSELGVQIDADSVLGGVPVTGYVRAAWAHYFRRDADMTASLIDLPGATFSATGARSDRDSMLVSAGLTARLRENVSLSLNLDGEVSANSSRIGGAAQIRVSF
ncbi:autotransporter domain-containing protein [Bosea sp. MMO-172]|uniref:autotransporter domain-containing protein n=1 Tax=Bosea sp. MMO-172 TaxID=3127885 RepID=UPI00301A9F9D